MLMKLYVVSDGVNLHNTYFEENDILECSASLINKPLICIFTDKIKEHARNNTDLKNQHCIGCIPETNYSKIEDLDDKKWLTVHAVIWKHYSNDAILKEIINNQNSDKKSSNISMEIEILESVQENGCLHIKKFRFMAISIISNNLQPAIPGANAKIIKYSTNDYSDMVNTTNKQLSQFTIPDIVKENAKKAIELSQENPQLINFAEDIIKNDTLSFSKVSWILNNIQNLKKEDNIMFFGGLESKEWCESIIQNYNSEQKQEKEDDDVQKESVEKAQLKFGLNSSQIREILNNALSQYKYKSGEYEWDKYYVEAYDEEFVYVWDCEDSNNKRMTYNISDNVAIVDVSSAEEVISAGYMLVGNKEPDINTNAVDGDTTDYKAKFEEMSAKYEEMSGKYAEMENQKNEMATNYSMLESDVESLKQFKADTEKVNLENKANELYSKYESYITEEEKADLNVKLFSVESFDIFKEKVFAIVAPKMEAENIALKQNKNEVDPNKIQFSTMPLLDTINKDENKSSFEKLKEYANS
jgi:hypothetical protein